MVFQCRSTRPFWCCLYGGDASIRMPSVSSSLRTSPLMSFLSKSVLMSSGLGPQSRRNFLTAVSSNVVRLVRP